MADIKTAKRRIPPRFMCGVMPEFCSGGVAKLNHGLEGRGHRAHQSPEDAFQCHKSWLIKQGFVPVGSRALASPDGGPIRILTKASRFGARLRSGKEGTRHMPHKRGSGVVSSY